MLQIIKKKRNGQILSKEEIRYVIDGVVDGSIPDYQLSAFLMAVYFQGMNDEETAWLTEAVTYSGDTVDLSGIEGIVVDKHSTGGVGDKTSLVICPLVAAAGVPIAKMSGRGLGHTGGTIDKLESFSGFSHELSTQRFIELVRQNNLALCGQSKNLVPADKRLYALRDVTATVKNQSLITASIMSKKFACGADAIVIDMKVGCGTYMKTITEAEELAETMLRTSRKMGRKLAVTLSAMDQPLGCAVGNALEVKEAIETLKGNGPDDLTELSLYLGSQMLVLGGKAASMDEARSRLMEIIRSGKAIEQFRSFIDHQGGNVAQVDHPNLLPKSGQVIEVRSNQAGFVLELSALSIGEASMILGAGRQNKDSKIDLGAGIILKKKVADSVTVGEVIAELHTDKVADIPAVEKMILDAFVLSTDLVKRPDIVIKSIGSL